MGFVKLRILQFETLKFDASMLRFLKLETSKLREL